MKQWSRGKSTEWCSQLRAHSPGCDGRVTFAERYRHGRVLDVNEQREAFLPIPDIAELLSVTASKVRRLIEDRHLAAKRIDKVLKVPTSFVSNGAVVPGVRGTLILLEDLGFSNDEAIDWILAPNDELGETPIEALRRGHKAPVRRAVQVLA